ncbi:MAG TPA: dihydroorotase [Dehalococcoidia bacterium]|jgi:dihydroorotase|nr:dihydroorotase [Dehalococcoidia bacterium]
MTNSLAIRGGRVIDSANGIDTVADVLIADSRITEVGPDAGRDASETIDASGLVVCPGFVDIHCHLREPGFEHKETIATGTLAAARGGFTTVCVMPNTEPPIDSAGMIEFILRTARTQGAVRVLPIACVTRGRAGSDLADLAELAHAGAIAFSDDGAPVADPHLMRRALEYAGMLGLPVIDHCEDCVLSDGGVMHEGWVSTRLGLRGIPSAAEESMVARDVALAEATGSHVHIAHVSTAGSVEIIRQAKGRGVSVTAEVTPHHLALTHDAIIGSGEAPGGLAYDTNAKVNPPLRTPTVVAACVEGLRDSTIDCIATDHAPHAIQDKVCEFDAAAFGISGLETALGLVLTAPPLEEAIRALTIGPVRAFGLDRRVEGMGTLSVGAPGDVAIIDPEAVWTVEPETFASKGKNTPLAGQTLKGRVVVTVCGGKLVFDGR